MQMPTEASYKEIQGRIFHIQKQMSPCLACDSNMESCELGVAR